MPAHPTPEHLSCATGRSTRIVEVESRPYFGVIHNLAAKIPVLLDVTIGPVLWWRIRKGFK